MGEGKGEWVNLGGARFLVRCDAVSARFTHSNRLNFRYVPAVGSG